MLPASCLAPAVARTLTLGRHNGSDTSSACNTASCADPQGTVEGVSLLCLIRVPQFWYRYCEKYTININKDTWDSRCLLCTLLCTVYWILIHHRIKVTTEEPSVSVPDAISWWYYLNVPRAPTLWPSCPRSHAPVNCETNPCKGPNGRPRHLQLSRIESSQS